MRRKWYLANNAISSFKRGILQVSTNNQEILQQMIRISAKVDVLVENLLSILNDL